jgi:rhamnulokinase
MRAIYESLALKYRHLLDKMGRLCGRSAKHLHIVGGGSANTLLNQMTADATGIPVIAGPREATAIGNAVVQFIALGEMGSIAQARAMLSGSPELQTFEPKHVTAWDTEYERFTGYVTTV